MSYAPERLHGKSSHKNVKECYRNLETEQFLEDAPRRRDLEGKVVESFAILTKCAYLTGLLLSF